jgi:hypothetical protein
MIILMCMALMASVAICAGLEIFGVLPNHTIAWAALVVSVPLFVLIACSAYVDRQAKRETRR